MLVAAMAIAFSCTDDSLDPLQFKAVKKGTILALRGDALQAIYFDGVPAAEVFPKIADGSETFSFEAEFLAEDVTTLASIDIYVIKKEGSARSRQLIRNVPFSAFKNDGTYVRPWVAQTLSLKTDILPKLGLDNTFPLSAAVIDALLSTYATGVNIEIDLNLTDGTKVLASQLVADGLYASDQFYPAQKLTWAMTDYCAYDANSWGGNWTGTETPGSVDKNKLTQDSTDPNKYVMDNWWGDGVEAYIIFTPSTNPGDQIVKVPEQTTSEGGVASGEGTYNQCLNTFSMTCKYVIGGSTYNFVYSFEKD